MIFRGFSARFWQTSIKRLTLTSMEEKNFLAYCFWMGRGFHQYTISKELQITSRDRLQIIQREKRLPIVHLKKNRPLVLLCLWVKADPRHVKKFWDLYLEKGFDVLTVTTQVWRIPMPKIGLLGTANQILEFLQENVSFQPILVHCLSIGSGVWSLAVAKMAENVDEYQGTVKRIKGQIWDSPPGVAELGKGFVHGVFPNSKHLRTIFTTMVDFTLAQDSVKNILMISYENFQKNPFKTPSLLFLCKEDPVSPFDAYMKDFENWKSMGIEAYVKWWENSRHVSHFHFHKKEYLDQLNFFLESINLHSPEMIKAVEHRSKL